MKRMWVGIVLLGLVAAACGSTKKLATTTTTAAPPTSTTSTTQLASAADVRTKISILFGDYQLIFDKSADALLGGRTEESSAYSTQLNANGAELGDLIGRTYGDDARAKFTGIWSAHTGYLFDYVSSTAKSDKATQDGAVFVLTNTFVPQFSDFFSSTTGIAKDAATSIATQHVSMTKAFIDAESTKDWPKAVKDDTAAFSQIQKIADSLSNAVSAKDSLIYPATGTTRASDLRVALNFALERHSYLITSATGAALGARNDAFTALNDELIVNTGVIGSVLASVNGLDASQFSALWNAQNLSFGSCAVALAKNDKPAQDSSLNDLTNSFAPQFATYVVSVAGLDADQSKRLVDQSIAQTKLVVDDQAGKKWSSVATDDRSTALKVQVLGDALSSAIAHKYLL